MIRFSEKTKEQINGLKEKYVRLCMDEFNKIHSQIKKDILNKIENSLNEIESTYKVNIEENYRDYQINTQLELDEYIED